MIGGKGTPMLPAESDPPKSGNQLQHRRRRRFTVLLAHARLPNTHLETDMRQRCWWMICSALAVSGCHLGKPDTPTPLGYTATACSGDYSFMTNRVECGTMVVEETRGSGNGRMVHFPVVTVRALNHEKADPVLWLHGGPGGGAIEKLPGRLKERRIPITEDRDWIFLDQRGAGMSTPRLDCGALGLSDGGITDNASATAAKACGERLTAQGIDLSQFNVVTVVKDLHDLRAARGIGHYNVFGVSYGSRVALAVMQHDPEGLRAVVLDSPWPPEANWTGAQPALVSRELRQVLALCASDSACNGKFPQLEARFDRMMQQWLDAPPLTKQHQYNADEVAAYVLESLYDDEAARRLPMVLDQIIGGDYSALDTFLIDRNDSVEGHFLAHLCKEEFAFESPAAIEGIDGHDPVAIAAAHGVARLFKACEGFAVGAPDPIENKAVVSALPTLLLSADIDAGCPTELAVAAARSLSHAQVFNMPNMTHNVGARSPCAKRMIAAFLDRPDATVDSSCIATDRPAFSLLLLPAPDAE